ncbi:glycoside hydrolase family 5 protein [Sporormia fimetaria CBS 119925]|uniref:glucan 1,3-beta-glucosidase n=1 Tax=Sporormia fimetaria CBS 119925 TaxID=1340428 RepID=A0A6A6V4F9_9PLEO|nr:glycoside hydrolase family 5 protein [Sporormia fimetaria CBS 119925]
MPRNEWDSDQDRDRDRDRRRHDRDRPRRQSHYESDADLNSPYPHDQRRRRGHRATDSQGELLPRPSPRNPRHSESEYETSPRKKRASHQSHSQSRTRGDDTPSGSRGSGAPLSLDAIAKLDKKNAKKAGWKGYDYDAEYLQEVRRKEGRMERDREREEREERRRERERVKREEERRRAYESDALAQEEARVRREKRRSERRGYYTDEEGRRGYHTEEERRRGYHTEEERSREHGDVRAKRKSYTYEEKEERRRRYEAKYTASEIEEKRARRREERKRMEQKRRVVSGPLAEEGGIDDDDEYEYKYMMEKRGGGGAPSDVTEDELARRKRLKRILIGVISFLILLAIIIPVAVMMSKKSGADESSGEAAAAGGGAPANSNLANIDPNTIPADKKGSILDPFAWYDTEEFNVTYTDETIGGLPVMGLNSTWSDAVQANENVPALNKKFEYGKMPIRGVNLGGWLNIEPFITPSFFEQYNRMDGIIDEYTLCSKLGTARCKASLEKHYSSFVSRRTFEEIRDAGFDHVRIPFGYWIVTTYPGDPYVKQVSWRYLLRAIEWARQNGLRINLDLHGAPGSQNGWNHSGRQGVIGWLNGTDGDLNGQRTLEIHHALSTFFSQPRYKNIITLYGLVNEPKMVDMDTQKVLSWTSAAISQIRHDGITALLVFGDGFFGLDNWQGKLQDHDNLLLDVHQYVIFNVDQISLKHTDKLNFACRGWTAQSRRSMDKTTGFGPTMCGEWSQADTDCTQYINNVGMGTRWEGTYNTGNASTSVLKPHCPSFDASCSCEKARQDASQYSDVYKRWLYQFAIAQMISFEEGWGWFYWTWETEKAVQWSWRKGMRAGILPEKVWERGFDCPSKLEDFEKAGLSEFY